MSLPAHRLCGRRKPVAVSIALAWLVLFSSCLQADTDATGGEQAIAADPAVESEVNFWADAAPLSVVINQLAHLSGRSAELGEIADAKVSGRFSATLGSTLARLSADYPVVFDLDGATLRATSSDERSNVSIATKEGDLSDAFKQKLRASATLGNVVEFREDSVRLAGHPAFVERLTAPINGAVADARRTDSLPEELASDTDTTDVVTTEPLEATSIADSGSAEVLVDIQDESKPPADQANLAKPIRWVTDIPGYNTF